MPDVKTAQQIAESQYAFGILFVVLFLISITAVAFVVKDLKKENESREADLKEFYKDQKTESQEREKKLMEHLERTTVAQEEMSRTLEKVQSGLKELSLEVKYLKRGNQS
ncbi:hypothetical protein [Aneurinibacillus migulanus]|uniref:Uncharacterized protein n=1 Tax=Aneurinibacillus migulanus TaxID=47500 RepID=A0A0D1YAS0_ANEMI|nr:hypothetical protein [Aneurinibacillus migulanus]KIV56227.1 hypothetical protein TS65_13510 [Aneurinibacillus migulanus]KON84295.1 hypothetical protein AF333_30660 [Aneurinibacillus migulanus]MED0893848.1 hypothetical protein [Aneurinibacillus migulanus]MED1614527.1 hypothetical protein [Aneurinibacillus migulanus]SDI84623.1 hypothetical protein SAMN04487909_108148 [Aneurinibacillus migulanus]